MARTLVTGGTGFIGSHVAQLLVQRGDDVRALVRGRTNLALLPELETVRGDVLDRRSVRRAMRGVERVFHLAGTTNLALSRERTFQLNVEGTRVVLEEALRAGVERVVYTSSVAAVGPAPEGQAADETNVWNAGRYRIAYVDSKHEAEVLTLRLIARGLPAVIVNPAFVLGVPPTQAPPTAAPGGSSTVLVRRFLRRQIPAYVDGTVNIVGVQDVARGHLLADERGRIGERYILGNRNYTIWRLFVDLGRLSGVEPPAVRLPLPVALALVSGARRIPGLRLPSRNEVLGSSLNWAVVNTKAKRELRWRTSPHEDCLEETIAWYRERDGDLIPPPGARQPVALRAVGEALRRTGLGR